MHRSPGSLRPVVTGSGASSAAARSRIRRLASAGQEVALAAVATEVGELLPSLEVLDAFGHRLQAEVVTEVDDRADDDGVVGVVVHVQHEGLVDLELVDREVLEVGEGGVTGAEVVDGEPDPDLRPPVPRDAGRVPSREGRVRRRATRQERRPGEVSP